MDIKDIKLKKGMSREEVNGLISEWIELEDDIYLGANQKHNWICKCGNTIERKYNHISNRRDILCKKCKRDNQEKSYKELVNLNDDYEYVKMFKSGEILPNGEIKDRPYIQIRHKTCNTMYAMQPFNFTNDYVCSICERERKDIECKHDVEKHGEYEYIRTYRNEDILPNGKVVKGTPYVQVKHKYCGSVYIIQIPQFILYERSCSKCCKTYENSFAHHIEVELGLKLEDVWDFEKNTVNPYHIWKGTDGFKIWIKCQEKDYHQSYQTDCYSFSKGNRCPYCSKRKIHPRDSFAQYHIDNTDKDFLEKYWDYEKNIVSPWEINVGTFSKVWIKCQDTDYHSSYETACANFLKGNRCPYCNGKKTHPKDSFGQYLIDNNLMHLWSDKNKLNPFEIARSSGVGKIYMLCGNHEYHNDDGAYVTTCNRHVNGGTCPYCSRKKIHPYDSFGYHHFDKVMSWHHDNEISPFRVARVTGRKYKFICETCGIEFEKRISNIKWRDDWCPECSMSEGEKLIVKWLRYNAIEYKYEKEFDGLLGVNDGNLSYDFYLYEYNTLIEFQGGQHARRIKMFHETEEDFERQLEHDRRKREYAKNNGFKLIELWEEDKKNIEEILNKEIINKNKLI